MTGGVPRLGVRKRDRSAWRRRAVPRRQIPRRVFDSWTNVSHSRRHKRGEVLRHSILSRIFDLTAELTPFEHSKPAASGLAARVDLDVPIGIGSPLSSVSLRHGCPSLQNADPQHCQTVFTKYCPPRFARLEFGRMSKVAVADPVKLSTVHWLICIIASIGFAFDIYELLMLPLIAKGAIGELVPAAARDPSVAQFWRIHALLRAGSGRRYFGFWEAI